MAEVEVRPLTGHIGVELRGVDLAGGGPAVDVLRTAVLDHHVVFVRGQHLGPGQLLELAGRFGDILRNPLSPKVEGFPDVTELVTYDGRSPDVWHFDTSYAEVPPMASLLTMVQSPPVGGDTLWVSGHAVYDSFSPAVQAFLGELRVVYRSTARLGPVLEAEHPLVAVHPDTARKSLRFDPLYATHVVGLRPRESEAVLQLLRTTIADPTFACRHAWRDGDFAMWDNRCTLHRVASDYIGERIIHRVTVAGTA